MDENKNIEVKRAFDEIEAAKEEQEVPEAPAKAEVHTWEAECGTEERPEETAEPITARDAWHAKAQGAQERQGAGTRGDFYTQVPRYVGAAGTYEAYAGGASYGVAKKRSKKKPVFIFCGVIAAMILLGVLFSVLDIGKDKEALSGASGVDEKHIGVLYIEGSIMEGDSVYDHEYVLDAIEGMKDNAKNKGLMLYVNSPGGGVYESDEVYLKIKEYQEVTGRPVYAYFGSQATSGGYYVAASADKIVANRNCWTGSIGVIIGTLYDISGLLEKYDIQAENIVSGDNKAMGSTTEPLTEEQRAIMQSLVDEAYAQFVGVIAEGRGLSEAYVRSVSDGRIYSAQQAVEIKLVDEVVNTYEEALADMRNQYGLQGCAVHKFRYEADYGIWESLLHSIDRLSEASASTSELGALTQLMEGQQEYSLQYMCEVRRYQ